ncbi:DUF488 domain-containing protein [Aeromicrobium sp.]|uniref:DUF488 domain-containing protein n=1 Tax=Aeromicrobium sp. TaxID=1871063 RepID=UPI0028AB073B|nr:DUF488 domain-containing protein [Aeromicrobium sp.]
MSAPLLTIGHGTSDRAELAQRLRDAGIQTLVDVRRFPGSRRNPEVARDAMRDWVPDEGIGYVWEERLGGRRRVPKDAPDVDAWWRVEAFRAYAAYTREPEFRAAMAELVERVQHETVAVMCSEFVWWRCHRRLISDVATLVHDLPVEHVMPDGRRSLHEPSEGARLADGLLTYPG